MFRSVEQLSSPGECDSGLVGMRPRASGSKGGRGRGSAWGSISRVFARSRHRTKSGSAVTSGHESGKMRHCFINTFRKMNRNFYISQIEILRLLNQLIVNS